jgi:hypothetical protein
MLIMGEIIKHIAPLVAVGLAEQRLPGSPHVQKCLLFSGTYGKHKKPIVKI